MPFNKGKNEMSFLFLLQNHFCLILLLFLFCFLILANFLTTKRFFSFHFSYSPVADMQAQCSTVGSGLNVINVLASSGQTLPMGQALASCSR